MGAPPRQTVFDSDFPDACSAHEHCIVVISDQIAGLNRKAWIRDDGPERDTRVKENPHDSDP